MPTPTIFNAESHFEMSVESQLNRLVLESNALAEVIQTFRGLVPSLLSSLKDKFTTIKDDDEQSDAIVALVKGHKSLMSKSEHVPFLSFNQTLISVPENYKGKFLDYAEFLNKAAPGVYNDALETLEGYKNLLVMFLSSKETTANFKDHSAFFLRIQNNRVKLTEGFKTYFPKDTGLSKQRLYSVIDRYADFNKLVSELNTLEKMHDKQNLRAFRKAVQECVDLLELVIKRTEKESCDKISQTTAKNIAEGAYELAKFVEFIALFRFRVTQFIAAVQNTVDELNEVLQ